MTREFWRHSNSYILRTKGVTRSCLGKELTARGLGRVARPIKRKVVLAQNANKPARKSPTRSLHAASSRECRRLF